MGSHESDSLEVVGFVEEDVFPELGIVPKTGPILVHQPLKEIVATLVRAGCLRRRD